MIVDRRGFLRFGLGGAAAMVLAAAEPLLGPTAALAITGIDDVALGGLVLLMLTLGGYAVSSAVSDATLQAMGYSFSDFCQDSSNQAAAVTRAIADANNLGVEVNRANAESAATAIAAGTGAFADFMADAAETGRVAIDGLIGGVGGLQAALWGLVAQYQSTMLGTLAQCTASTKFSGNESYTVGGIQSGFGLSVTSLATVLDLAGSPSLSESPTWALLQLTEGGTYRYLSFGTGAQPYISGTAIRPTDGSSTAYRVEIKVSDGTVRYMDRAKSVVYFATGSSYLRNLIVNSDMVVGAMLPGVDKAADAPATLGAGYDKTPIGADAVIGNDGDVVSSGTIALPIQLPGVDVPYSQGLYGLDAGVVSGLSSVPYSAGLTDAWVGTQEGVVSMPISQAIASSTSIGATVAPSEPVVPPDTPDVGPWQPAYDLPFYDVWPFNLVYTFVEQISALGGAS